MAQKKKKSSAVQRKKKVGRPKNTDIGLKATLPATVRVESDVIEICKEKYGSLSNALRFAAVQ